MMSSHQFCRCWPISNPEKALFNEKSWHLIDKYPIFTYICFTCRSFECGQRFESQSHSGGGCRYTILYLILLYIPQIIHYSAVVSGVQ